MVQLSDGKNGPNLREEMLLFWLSALCLLVEGEMMLLPGHRDVQMEVQRWRKEGGSLEYRKHCTSLTIERDRDMQ